MKESKREIKYIIRRILIGVGIAVILFNLKKCNAYALTKIQVSVNSVSKITDTTGKKKVGEYKDSLLDLEFYFDNNNSFNYYYPIIYKYRNQNDIIFAISGITSIEDLAQENISLGSIGTTKDTAITSQYTVQYPPNLFLYDNNNNLICNVGTSCNSSNNAPFTAFNYMQYNFMVYNYTQDTVNSGMNSNIFGQYIYNNTNIDFYNSNVPFDLTIGTKDIDYTPPVQDPLQNYTQLDLTGYQAVLIVPKNYQTMLSDSSHTNEFPPGTFRTYLDLEYYSQYCVRGSLINIENVQDIMLNNIGVGTGNLAESISGTCYQEPTQTIMSYEFDQYSGLKARGLLVYNGSQDWQSGFGTETPFFGTSYVWYNPELYNAYLVQYFDDFNQTISYKDYLGEDHEVTIESLPTFTESMENAIDNVDSPTPTEINKQKLQAVFNFLKTPFTFLNKLNTTSCSAIVFPLPFVNKNLTLECMSTSVYNRYLPNILKTFIITILNGLIFYRCTLNNIDIFTNILDPEDNKLEAIDL